MCLRRQLEFCRVAPIDLNFGPYKAFKDASFESDIIEFYSNLYKNHKACPGNQGLSSNVRDQVVIPANGIRKSKSERLPDPHDRRESTTARPAYVTGTTYAKRTGRLRHHH